MDARPDTDPLGRPVTSLRGVGPGVAARLERLGIRTLQDLLLHLPLRYEDRTRLTPISRLRPGSRAQVCGTIEQSAFIGGPRRQHRLLLADESGYIEVRFFHVSQGMRRGFTVGSRMLCFGEVRWGRQGLELTHPEFRMLHDDAPPRLEERLSPVYPTTEGLGQKRLRDLVDQALAQLEKGGGLEELLPHELLEKLGLPPLRDALLLAHRPPPEISLAELEEGRLPGRERLAFEELLAHHVALRRLRARAARHRAPPLPEEPELVTRFLEALPFRLTGAQERVRREVAADLARPHPMMRLAQGDVGCGKTVVAACALLQAVADGRQAAFMAPTELLAEQHARNLRAWLEPLGISLAHLNGRKGVAERRSVLAAIASGEARVAVGTHALFQPEVRFRDLALVVVDEQHRFGVDQRLALREKGEGGGLVPHQLIMTATPIPRTLAMTFYADLDVSVIDELPPGRTPIQTAAIPMNRRDEVIARVGEAARAGRQIYWTCTQIEESEESRAQAAEESHRQLSEALPDLRIGLVHGRMKGADKDAVMERFKAHQLDLLVATTVIEVGVDVPNASLMVIENAERLGLAQLHQLRGRVGRGATESACILLYQPPLSDAGRARLAALRETHDGFVIAQRDLELRGPGEVLGTRQSGDVAFRTADLALDQPLLPLVQQTADSLLADDPARAQRLIDRWLGPTARYGEA